MTKKEGVGCFREKGTQARKYDSLVIANDSEAESCVGQGNGGVRMSVRCFEKDRV